MVTDKKKIQAYLDESVKKLLAQAARRDGRSVSNYVEKLIKDHLGIELSEEELARLAAEVEEDEDE
ncbi:MAG: TraY domain-containing protein [Cyanobacteria bacterium P01_F01_bin.86]